MMSLSTVARSPDKVKSSMKPIFTVDWSLSRRGCTASQNSKDPIIIIIIIIIIILVPLVVKISRVKRYKKELKAKVWKG